MVEVTLLLHHFSHSFDDEVNILIDSTFSKTSKITLLDDDVILKIDIEDHVIGEEPDVAFNFMVTK